ncbi:MAG: flagellar export chaperone FlgN [Lachnospiraceae bacterium]|nr:flagellar export chaperone FlgN [Lachnospiraceae bacterium]
MERDYIIAMRESLEKKLGILDEIYELSRLQQELLSEEEMDFDSFDRYFDDKDICIEKLNELDEGFELLYNRVGEVLRDRKESYAEEIRVMQDLIRKITDRSTSIEALEERNRKGIADALAKAHRQAKESKRSVSVAMNYYKQMNGIYDGTSSKMDKKK